MADQQLYGGTQSALSTTLLLWRTSAGAEGAPIVEKERSRPSRSLLVVAVAQRGGVRTPRPYPGMVTSWHAASPAVNDHAGDDPPDRLVEHRQAIVMMLPRDKQLAA
jgi:hypothetical protein